MALPALLERNIKRWEFFAPEIAPHFYNLPELDRELPPYENLDGWFRTLDLSHASVLYVYGNGFGAVYQAAKPWLSGDKNRFLVIFEDDCYLLREFFKTAAAEELLHDPQVYLFPLYYSDDELFRNLTYFVELPYQMAAIPFYATHKADLFHDFCAKTEFQLNITLRSMSEHLSMGDQFFSNYFTNLTKQPSSYWSEKLFGKFHNVPAIICGAGPSLEKVIPYLEQLKDKALIFAGGTSVNALNAKGVQPHLGVGLDPHVDQYYRIIANNAYEVPYFYRNRMNPKAYDEIHGEKIFINGAGGYPIAPWIEERLGIKGTIPEEGYNVVCFSVSLAKNMGCNPIILVGLDLAYTDNQSYSEGIQNHPIHQRRHFFRTKDASENLISRNDVHGNPVLTLWKWIMESLWFTKFADRFPDVHLINATDGGIGCDRIPNIPLESLMDLIEIAPKDVEGKLFSALAESEFPPTVNSENIKEVLITLQDQLSDVDVLLDKILATLEASADPDALIKELEQKELFKHTLYEFGRTYRVLYEREYFRFHIDGENKQREREIQISHYNFFKDLCHNILKIITKTLVEGQFAVVYPQVPIPNDLVSVDDVYKEENGRLIIDDKEMGFEIDAKLEKSGNQIINGLSEFKSKDGIVLSRTWYHHGQKIGKCARYFASGKLAALLQYDQGKLESTQRYFYPHGQLKSELNYKNGAYHGRQTLYYPNGAVKKELSYEEGKRHGAEHSWNEHGELRIEAHYNHSVPVGVAREWHSNGKLKSEIQYSEDDPHFCHVKEYDQEGNLLLEEDIKQDDYFELYAKRTGDFTGALKSVCENMNIFTPLMSEFSQIDEAFSLEMNSDLDALTKELHHLEDMNKKLMEEVGLESHKNEPIWKTPQARQELEEQFDEVSVNLKQGLENVQKSLHDMVSKLNKIEKDLPKND